MKKTEEILITELDDSLRRKIKLLKSINSTYSNAIDLIESKNFEQFLEKLEKQHSLLKQLNEVDSFIKSNLKNIDIPEDVVLFLDGSKDLDGTRDYNNIPKVYCNLIKLSNESKKLLKSTRILNEKLTYKVMKVRSEIIQNMSEAKNRRLIHSGYGKKRKKTGLLFDYKHTLENN